jgi:hypothetical protein
MSILVLKSPMLGTYTDACMLKEKMEKHFSRMGNLYGVIEEEQQSNVYCQTKVREIFMRSNTADIKRRKSLDTVPKELLARKSDVPAPMKVKYFCIFCGKADKIQGVMLSKCSACEQVYYCSKECQRADWKDHKGACKMLQK